MVFGSRSKKKKMLPLPPPPLPPRPSGHRIPEPPFPSGMEIPRPGVSRLPRKPVKAAPARAVAEKAALERKAPPLFIKVERYKDIIKNIQELKSYALGLRDALDAIGDIEKELKNGLELTNRALDRFNTIISLLDAKLLKFHDGETKVGVPKEVDEYVKDLYGQMERVRHELKTIESEAGS